MIEKPRIVTLASGREYTPVNPHNAAETPQEIMGRQARTAGQFGNISMKGTTIPPASVSKPTPEEVVRRVPTDGEIIVR